MTREEYGVRRKFLLEQLQDMIDSNVSDDVYEAKKAEIDKLDTEWDTIAQRAADARVLSDEQRIPAAVQEWGNGSYCSMDGYGYQPRGSHTERLYLGNRYTMQDFAAEGHPDERVIADTPNALADTVRGIVTGKWSRPELKNAISTSGTAVLIPSILSARVIDKARELSLFGAAGVPVVPMESNNLTISRIAEDPTFAFKAEGAAAEESSFTLDSVQLRSHTLYGYCYVTLEAIESSRNLEDILYHVFSQAAAQAIDQAMLYGQSDGEGGYDTFAPAGIMNDTDILTLASTGGYSDFIRAAGKIRKENGVPTIAAMNSVTDEALQLLADPDGHFIEPPAAFTSLRKIVTNQLAYDAQTGSDALVFDAEAMLIGIQNNLRIRMIEGSDEAIRKGMVAFQLISMLDCKVIRPKAICKITGIGAEG